TSIFSSKGEIKRMMKNNAISINKEKIQKDDYLITDKNLINNKYIVVQKGKKNYFLIIVT
ncbi:MAG: tyrosine--tRNA ligase, partial [Bacteroidota bacterium]|nr:tyrosine--tRNA ligase [Bacteroidota bacterium]